MKSLAVLFVLFVSAQSFAIEYRAKPVTVKSELSSLKVAPTLLSVDVPVYRVDTYYDIEQTTCNRVDCADVNSDGTTGNWHDFYTTTRDKKAKALSDAIKGIGVPTAELVLKAGYFKSKPRSWVAFSAEITSAQATLARQGYQGKFADLVLNQYGSENAKNLGYYVEGSCQVVTYPCSVIVEKERETFVYNLNRKIEVSMSNVVLQSFEREPYSIRVGFDAASLDFQMNNYYNQYSVSLSRVSQEYSKIQVVGVKRNLIPLPQEAGQASLSVGSDGLVISGNVNPIYLPKDDDAGSRLVIEYKLCRIDWFGGCHTTMVDTTQETINGTSFSINVPASKLRKGSKHKVWYTIKRLGSKYYNAEGSDQKTDSVKFK